MEIKISIPEYSSSTGLKYEWEKGFEIYTKLDNTEIIISANKEGLISLARHMLMLAQDNIPANHHLHFDEHNSLEEGSLGLIIQKITS